MSKPSHPGGFAPSGNARSTSEDEDHDHHEDQEDQRVDRKPADEGENDQQDDEQ